MTNESIPTIFIAYSQKDKEHLEELRTFIAPLIRSKKVNVWFDGEIRPGAVWDVEIKKALHGADIILLLVSPNSLNSDYFYEKEVADALERHSKNEARVIPIILNPCLWDDTPLHQIQVLPKGAKPISEWQNKNSAWDDVARGIKNSIDEINTIKSIAQQKLFEAKLKKEKEDRETQLKEEEKRKKEEKELKKQEFLLAIKNAEQNEKEKNWIEAEKEYRKALIFWETSMQPSKEKILSKVSTCISMQNIEEYKEIKPSEVNKGFSNVEYPKNELSIFFRSTFFAYCLLGISLYALSIINAKMESEKKSLLSNSNYNFNKYIEKSNIVNDYTAKFPFIIDDISATVSDGEGNQIMTSSSHELDANSVKYLAPVIEYRSFSSGSVTLLIKIFKPDGILLSIDNSPSGATYEYEFDYCVNSKYKNKWARIGGVGSKTPTYTKGFYRIEVWYQNYCLGQNTIRLK